MTKINMLYINDDNGNEYIYSPELTPIDEALQWVDSGEAEQTFLWYFNRILEDKGENPVTDTRGILLDYPNEVTQAFNEYAWNITQVYDSFKIDT